MDPARAAKDLESFLAARGEPLLRTAALLAGGTDTSDFRWLRPTLANLAQFNVPVLAGYTRVKAP